METKEMEDKKIANVLDAWYHAMANKDMQAFAAMMTDTFVVVEHDTLISGADLVQMLTAEIDELGDAFSFSADLSDHNITVHGDVAWCTHRNFEVFGQRDGTKLELDFIETVVFQKSNGHWLMDRYHATKLREAVIGG
jgi:ketosteroid isomerase-like protein